MHHSTEAVAGANLQLTGVYEFPHPTRRGQRPDLALQLGRGRGTVNRIKMLKRHGRAKFDLLRKRVLLA